jgi:hypothetical protein
MMLLLLLLLFFLPISSFFGCLYDLYARDHYRFPSIACGGLCIVGQKPSPLAQLRVRHRQTSCEILQTLNSHFALQNFRFFVLFDVHGFELAAEGTVFLGTSIGDLDWIQV